MSTRVNPRHRAAATLLGIPVDEYAEHVERGEKRCSYCKAWQPREAFGKDRSASDGLSNRCRDADAEAKRRRYTKRHTAPPRPVTAGPDPLALLHEIYDLAAARVPHDEIMDTIRAAVGRP